MHTHTHTYKGKVDESSEGERGERRRRIDDDDDSVCECQSCCEFPCPIQLFASHIYGMYRLHYNLYAPFSLASCTHKACDVVDAEKSEGLISLSPLLPGRGQIPFPLFFFWLLNLLRLFQTLSLSLSLSACLFLYTTLTHTHTRTREFTLSP